MKNHHDTDSLKDEVAILEKRLQKARLMLHRAECNTHPSLECDDGDSHAERRAAHGPLDNLILHQTYSATHLLLLLSDSALPLGSFAYSSGLESYIAHHKPLPASVSSITSFHRFLELSLSSVASTVVPYLLAAYRSPHDLDRLDNDLDASTPCTVARRASVAQGKALLSVWERAFRPQLFQFSEQSARGVTAVSRFAGGLKASDTRTKELGSNGHFAPLWGSVCLSLDLDQRQAAYVYLLNHAKAVLSAAVRASVMGPYQAQAVLASQRLQDVVRDSVTRAWNVHPEDAGQVVPALDLWVGRHELLYSRIFNS